MSFALYTPFGVRVNAELGARATSLRDLAKALETSGGHLWKVLHGMRTSKTLEDKIKKYFGWE